MVVMVMGFVPTLGFVRVVVGRQQRIDLREKGAIFAFFSLFFLWFACVASECAGLWWW